MLDTLNLGKSNKKSGLILVAALAAVLLAFGSEAVALHFSYYTLGDVPRRLLAVVVIFINFVLGLFFVVSWLVKKKFPRAFFGAILLLALLVGTTQSWLGLRLNNLHREAQLVEQYITGYHQIWGKYPPDLEKHAFHQPKIKANLSYRVYDDGTNFELRYWVLSSGIAYIYSSYFGSELHYEDD